MYKLWEMETIDNEKKIKAKIIFEESIEILRKNFVKLKDAYLYTDHALVSRIIEDLYCAYNFQEKESHYVLPKKEESVQDLKDIIYMLKDKWWSLRRIWLALGMSHERVRNF